MNTKELLDWLGKFLIHIGDFEYIKNAAEEDGLFKVFVKEPGYRPHHSFASKGVSNIYVPDGDKDILRLEVMRAILTKTEWYVHLTTN